MAAETHAEDVEKNMAEQRSLLEDARAQLADTFKALAHDALAQNNSGFLTLAEQKFRALKDAASGELEARQTAIASLVAPLSQTLAEYQKQAQELQSQMQSTILEASSGGGAVTVKMNGQKRLLSIKIEPDAAGDVEMLQDLVVAAVNEASRKVDEAVQASVGGMLGGMGMPI